MSDNCFIDTNILVYCYSEDEPLKQKKALNIAKHSTTFISTQVLTELANTLNKKFKLDWETVEKVLFELRSEMNIFLNKPAIIEQSCQIADKYKYSFYDSLIIAAALSCNCKTLYSEDLRDGQVIENSLTIVNPLK